MAWLKNICKRNLITCKNLGVLKRAVFIDQSMHKGEHEKGFKLSHRFIILIYNRKQFGL